MKIIKDVEFTDEIIRKIFGSYDGEGEDIERLKEYYFKTDTYNSIIADIPVRILVGSKGVGKSALFRISMNEQKEKKMFPILIKPDDIAEIGEKHESLILSIRKWKFGLIDIIVKKVLDEFGISNEGVTGKIIKSGGKIIPLIQEIINQPTNLTNVNRERKQLINNFKATRKIIVYLDDLDRGWQNRKNDLIMISALINSIRDLASENDGLQFKLALRLDVYNSVRTEDESSDKFEGLVIWHFYSFNEIFGMLVKRVITYFGESFDETTLLKKEQHELASNLDPIFEKTFHIEGKIGKISMHRALLSLIRNRPRDLVKLCAMSAKKARNENSAKINSSHILDAMPNFSRSLINDTLAEYKSELPQIERLIYGMKPNRSEGRTGDSFCFTTSELNTKIYKIIQQGQFVFASGNTATVDELCEFLFRINFIVAKKRLENGSIVRKTYEHESHLSSKYIKAGYEWEILLPYRWAIQPESLDDIIQRIPD